ncbi:hypothetical protein SBP28_004239 [Candidozyma auris]
MGKLKTLGKRFWRKWTTREGLLGDYDYGYLFIPDMPFKKGQPKTQPFFGLNSSMPLVLGMILGLQHSLAMLAGVITPPMLISTAANLSNEIREYLISTSLIVAGSLSCIQITRFHIYKTPYYIGTGLLSVVGTSFATITICTKAMPLMYKTGLCPMDGDKELPCPDGYGRIIATGTVCALLEILLSFAPSKVLQRVFPPLVTGPVVLLIGTHLVETGFQNWMGGSNCVGEMCGTAKKLQWGSAEYLGLGFSVYATIVLSERFGSPIMKSCAVIMGLLVGCIIAAACGYFSSENIDSAPVATFPWVHTFKLQVYGPAVLPFFAGYIVLIMEAIGDITATCDVSRLEVEGEMYESRIQGGVLADGVNSVIAGLMTMTPVSTFAQNNGVISVTKCANRKVGYWYRFVLTAALVPGIGSVLVPNWFDNVFTYSGGNTALMGFFDAITLVMETGFAITGFVGLILNLIIPQVDEEMEEINEVVLETVGSATQEALEVYKSREQIFVNSKNDEGGNSSSSQINVK